jgi:hypothetical protein
MNKVRTIFSALSATALAAGLLTMGAKHAQAETGAWGSTDSQLCFLKTSGKDAEFNHYKGLASPYVDGLSGADRGVDAVFCDPDESRYCDMRAGVSASIRARATCTSPSGATTTITSSWSTDQDSDEDGEQDRESVGVLCPVDHSATTKMQCQIKQ